RRVDHTFSYCCCYLHSKTKGRHEVKERCPHYRLKWGQYPGGHNRGDGIRGIVKTIDEIEDQGNDNEKNHQFHSASSTRLTSSCRNGLNLEPFSTPAARL